MVSSSLWICFSTLFVQTISAQCLSRPVYPNIIPEAPMAYPGPIGIVPETMIPEAGAVFNGGGFKVTSYSSAGPTGIKVQSEDLIVEGPLAVTGSLPFLGVVTVEGPLPAVGEGSVAYGCGNGNVGIVSEGVAAEPLVAAGYPGLGYNGIPNVIPNMIPNGIPNGIMGRPIY